MAKRGRSLENGKRKRGRRYVRHGGLVAECSSLSIGEEPIAVLAQERTDEPERFVKADETTLFQLEFPCGALANCMTSLGLNINTLEVTAEQGWYRLQPFQAYNNVRGINSKGHAIDQYIENQQARQMDDDALAILNDTAVLVPFLWYFDGAEKLRCLSYLK